MLKIRCISSSPSDKHETLETCNNEAPQGRHGPLEVKLSSGSRFLQVFCQPFDVLIKEVPN